jgi:hypothetical protein
MQPQLQVCCLATEAVIVEQKEDKAAMQNPGMGGGMGGMM